MLLLDDNFSSIVNGVEEGRLIFDNLKKSIAYTLASNIPEIWPFIYFIIFQVPLPLTTVLILTIDLGTDMVPAIAYAYENAELDIMERWPRNAKRDYLVGKKLISYSYLQIGMLQQFGGFYIYYQVMNDYGLRPYTLFNLDPRMGYVPKPTDVYNPNMPHNGNTNYGNPDLYRTITWLKTDDASIDLRLFYTDLGADSWSKCRWTDGEADEGPYWYRYSDFTDKQICYTTEALRHAHTAYLVGIVCVQWSDCMITKTRSLSISQQGIGNQWGNFGFFFETCLVSLIAYAPFLNVGFQTRPIACAHFAVPAFNWIVTIVCYDELRKIFLRAGMKKHPNGMLKQDGWVLRNTYY